VIVERAIDRARRRAPSVTFAAQLQPGLVRGQPALLERAILNVLDNAAKWSPPGGTIDVVLADGVLTVRDHGAGFDAADLPHVFDRFYRAAAARSLPGSGLGLAIAKQTVEDHGGTVEAANAEDGGALITLRFPPTG